MEAKRKKLKHFCHCFQTQKTKWSKFSFEHLLTNILIIFYVVPGKKYVLQLLNVSFFKILTYMRDQQKNNGTMRRFYEFYFLSYKVLYAR